MRKNKACALLATTLLLTVVLSGCGDTTGVQQRIMDAVNSTATDTNTQSDVEKAVSDLQSSYATDKDNPDQLLPRMVRFSEADMAVIWAAIGNIKVDYPYTDISNVEEALAKYGALPEIAPRKATGLLSSGRLDAEELYQSVIANNARYKENGAYKYADLDDDYIKGVCQVISDTVNRELHDYDFTDILGDLDYTLTNLCVFSGISSLSNAFVGDDGCMVIQPELTKNMEWLANNDQAVSIVYSHEVEHLFQRVSTEVRQALGVERAYGFCCVFSDLEVNSLYFNWFLEAAAEKLATALYDSEPTTYATKVGYMDSLTFAEMLRDSVSPVDVPRLTQQRSLERVFELFGLDTYDRQIEFLNMMWAINVMQESPKDFMDAYAQKLGHEPDYEFTEDELTVLRIEMKASLCATLSKYFYENLAEQMSGESVSITDLFLLISTWEADLNYHITYTDETRYENVKDFLTGYAEIQTAFFERAAANLDIKLEELTESYNAYNAAVHVPKRNSFIEELNEEYADIAIPWLTSDENSFISKQFNSIGDNKTVSIRQMLDIYAKFQ